MKTLITLTVALGFCWAGAAFGQELILNGGFEQPVVDQNAICYSGGTGWDYCYSDDVPGWTVYWVTAGTLGNLELHNANVNLGGPYAGSQYAEMDTHGSPTGSDANVRIYQDLATCPGADYTISYAWRPRPNVGSTSMVLDVYWDGTNIATHSSSGGDWRPESTNKSATLSTTRLEFEEVGTGDQLGTFLDAVSVEEVPGTCYIEIDIDIKPQSYPNCFNLNGNGVIPVAILGSADFDVSEIDVLTLTFAGMDVRLKGNGAVQCSVEDVSGDFTSPEGAPDGYPDLVCQFVDDPDTWAPDDGTATVEGELLDGTAFRGTDEICLRPE